MIKLDFDFWVIFVVLFVLPWSLGIAISSALSSKEKDLYQECLSENYSAYICKVRHLRNGIHLEEFE